VNIPGFIARQFYVSRSLRNTETGWELQAHNPMGDGILVGVRKLRLDGREIAPENVTASRTGEAAPIRAADVSRERPVSVYKGDRVTLAVEGERLAPGEHRLDVELVELNLGAFSFSIKDRVE
jgi:hypothetical protein